MWCLCRLLPLMIGHRVSKTDKHWLNFLQLLEIIDIVFAPVISKDAIAYLRVIIKEHHESFTELYPHCSITPKMHYMVHYPQWISRYVGNYVLLTRELKIIHTCVSRCGPLIRFWTMRFESKHHYFKDLCYRVRCFKNIPKTLINHHQRLWCLYCNTTLSLRKDTLSGPSME